uniref:Uncharacterized protein n=1 Tax=Palpitomonas bilix TaxID=652834 RepID=A0A7S3GAG7_9EUKA|mmetsp:Transcript_32846/g.84832  ORF Transcript_32846/g.84832 Transcript_32846/m.84832 type:complete len:210 (+) Transcript_32846:192-821(+)
MSLRTRRRDQRQASASAGRVFLDEGEVSEKENSPHEGIPSKSSSTPLRQRKLTHRENSVPRGGVKHAANIEVYPHVGQGVKTTTSSSAQTDLGGQDLKDLVADSRELERRNILLRSTVFTMQEDIDVQENTISSLREHLREKENELKHFQLMCSALKHRTVIQEIERVEADEVKISKRKMMSAIHDFLAKPDTEENRRKILKLMESEAK